MQLLAKPVLENKFYIVEKNGQKVGTIRTNGTGVILSIDGKNVKYPTLQEVPVQYTDKQIVKKEQKIEFSVHDFPCKTKPFNSIFDLKRKLPLYTKTKNSQSFFCAGYYVIHWEDGGHSPSYCPKLITLSRYQFEGPFKTKLEMTEILRKVDAKT